MEDFSVRTMTQSPTFIVIYQLSTQTQLHDSTVENSARLYLPWHNHGYWTKTI